jgi:SEC-C motif-containing protein
MRPCPCGLDKNYPECCGAFIDGGQSPSTPEQLMRSRYTAYTQANVDYIASSMKPPASNNFNPTSTREFAERAQWKKLDVLETSTYETKGFVEFFAHFMMNDKKHIIHEKSEFHLLDGKWYYVDGIDPKRQLPISTMRVTRNEPCLCGSGQKYKRCCGQTYKT